MVLVMAGRLVVTGVDEDVVGWTVGLVTCCRLVVGTIGVATLAEDVVTGTTVGGVVVGVTMLC
jgi:hypothetical protein